MTMKSEGAALPAAHEAADSSPIDFTEIDAVATNIARETAAIAIATDLDAEARDQP